MLGDHEAILENVLPGLIRLPVWPHPLLLTELISQAAAVVGQSYHLAITALAFGVPVFSSADLTVGKYTALSGFETIYPLPKETDTDPLWFVTRLGKTTPTRAALAARDQLAQHWDRVAAVIDDGSTDTQCAVSEFLQSLPNLLELAAGGWDAQGEELRRVLTSPSWKVTAPARFVMRNLKRLVRKQKQ